MKMLEFIEEQIINTKGQDQEQWVELYEEMLNNHINIQIAKTYKDNSKIWFTDSKGELKSKSLNESERIELFKKSIKSNEKIKKSIHHYIEQNIYEEQVVF